MSSEWKIIPGFETPEISKDGLVRNTRTLKVSKSHLSKAGYVSVALPRNGRYTVKLLHRLLALTFIGPPPEGKPNVLHGDGNPQNNDISNLRWGDQSENMRDAVSHGTQKNQNRDKTHCIRGHLFDKENTIIAKQGRARKCRTCEKSWQREHRLRGKSDG
jgi:hypothetical protein